MTTSARIPVIVLSGFLGSGKTTLLNALLRQPTMANSAVIVNELGEIAIDQLLVAGSAENLVVLDSGCLCCAMLNSFRETLLDLCARRARVEVAPFTRVVVETTGLADPAPVVQSLLRDSVLGRYFRYGGLVTTVDATHGAASLQSYRECVAQLAIADRVVITKTDRCGGVVPPALQRLIRDINALAPCVIAGGSADAASVLPDEHEFIARDAAALESPAPGPASEIWPPALHASVRADSFLVTGRVTWSGIAAWTDAVSTFFGRRLLRCKGFIELTELGRPVVVQGVQGVFAAPEPLASWPDADRRSRLVCISQDLAVGELAASLPLLQTEAGMFRPATLAEMLN